MTTYRATFERIGRNHDVPPLDVQANDADDIAKAVWKYARPHLGSRDIEVLVELDELRGFILAGFNNGGRFTLAEVSA